MRPLILAALAALFASCGWISFARKTPAEAVALEQSVRAYYEQVSRAFSAADAEALARLFSRGISKPMTRDQIRSWAERFFEAHGGALFVVEKLEIDELGARRAVARLTYRVVTGSGKGDFGGQERDVLIREGGRWVISEWEKL